MSLPYITTKFPTINNYKPSNKSSPVVIKTNKNTDNNILVTKNVSPQLKSVIEPPPVPEELLLISRAK